MVNERKCRLDFFNLLIFIWRCTLDANRELSPWKMTPSTSPIIPDKWTCCWITKKKYCAYTLFSFREVAGHSEEAPTVLGVYYQSYAYQYLLALIALIIITRWNQNSRRIAGLTFSAFHDWSIDLCRLFSVRWKQDASDTKKYSEKHQIDWDSATCITYSTDYYQRLTLESWFTNLEQTPLSRSQELPAPYKRLIDEIKQN